MSAFSSDRLLARATVGTVLTLVSVAAPAIAYSSPAHAADDAYASSASAEATADLVASVAPSTSTADSASADDVEIGDSGSLQAGAFTLPADGDGAITAGEVSVTLPPEIDLGAAEVTEDGVAVYEGESVAEPSVAVFSDGSSTAVHTIVPTASSPLRYSYAIEGATLVPHADGSIALIGPGDEPLGIIAAPWAADAAGQPVRTYYEVDGDTFVQVISPTANTAFPVVADPDLWFIAKCSAAITLFAAENLSGIGKVWRVFRSASYLRDVFWSLRAMSFSGKVRYLRTKLGSTFYELSGWSDLITRCTP